MVSIIVAVAQNNALGKNNKLLWHIPDDLKFFKQLTSGHTIIMGRNTWESLPRRPLPNRRHIVISKNVNFKPVGAEVANSVNEALQLCNNNDEIFVIGGAMVYQLFIPVATKIYVTKVLQNFDADTFFPDINWNNWNLIDSTLQGISPEGLAWRLEVYERKVL